MANQGFGLTYRKLVMNHIFGKTPAFTTSAGVFYIGLHTGDPGTDGASGAGNEVTGGSYARKLTAAGDWATATAADPNVVLNSNVLTFPTATGSWGTVTYAALWLTISGTTSADFVARIPVPSQAIISGNIASFPISALAFNFHFDP